MANSAEYDVIINVITGHLEKATKQLRGMAGAVDGVNKANRAASKSGKEHNDIINGGVASANNGTRGFAKLKESINGSNGIVAAYATLATNAFALSAAFNQLKEARNVDIIMQGLATTGQRTGIELTTVSSKMKDITGQAIDMADAMKYTSQLTAAGLDTSKIEQLTRAATTAGYALGRDIPDSIQRLTLAVAKNEPELVDELGMTIKSAQAWREYGLAVGKSADQLSDQEKKLALLNSWVKQTTDSYGDLTNTINPNEFNQLSASFSELVRNSISGTSAFLHIGDAAKYLSESTVGLTATLVIFLSTISKQLIPGLYNLDKASTVRRASIEKEIRLQKERIIWADKAAKASTTKEIKSKVEDLSKVGVGAKDLKGKDLKIPENYASYLKAEGQGTATVEQRDAALKSLTRSQSQYNRFVIEGSAAYKAASIEERAAAKSIFDIRAAQIAQLKEIIALKAQESTQDLANSQKLSGMRRQNVGSRLQGLALTKQASAIEEMGSGSIKTSLAEGGKAISVFNRGIDNGVKAAEQLGTKIPVVTESLAGFRKVLFATETGVKMLTSGLLRIVPYIGWAMLAWDLFGDSLMDLFGRAFNTSNVKKAAADLEKIATNAGVVIQRAEKDQLGISISAEETVKNVIAEQKAIEQTLQALQKLNEERAKEKDPMAGVSMERRRIHAIYEEEMGLRKKSNETEDAAQKKKLLDLAEEKRALSDTLMYIEDINDQYKIRLTQGELKNPAQGLLKYLPQLGNAVADEMGKFHIPENVIKDAQILRGLLALPKGEQFLDTAITKTGKAWKDLDEAARGKVMAQAVSAANEEAKKLAIPLGEVKSLLTEAKNAADSFALSLKPKTNYDDVVSSLQKINVALIKAKAAVADTSFKDGKYIGAPDTKAVADYEAAVIDSANSVRDVLSVSTKQQLDNLDQLQSKAKQAADAAAAASTAADTAKAKDPGSAQAKAAEENRVKAIDAAKIAEQAFLTERHKTVDLFSEELKTKQALFETAQAEAVVGQSLVGLAQARLSVLERQGVVTAEDYLKKVASENNIKKMQISALDIQKKLLDIKYEEQKQALVKAKSDLDAALLNEKQIIQNNIKIEQLKLQNALTAKNAEEQAKAQAALTELTKPDYHTAEYLRLEAASKAAENALRPYGLQMTSITNQQKAIRETMVNVGEAQIESQRYSLQLQEKITGLQDKERKTRSDIEKIRREGAQLLVRTIPIYNKLIDAEQEAQSSITSLVNDYASQLAENQINLQKAQFNHNESQINYYTKVGSLLMSNFKAESLRVSAQLDLNRLQLLYVDILDEGLQIQQNALEPMQKALDIQSSILDQKKQMRQLDAQIAAKDLGTEISPEQQRKLDILSAKEALQNARQQLAIKIEGIKLEYALLEAQRIQSQLSLKARRQELAFELMKAHPDGKFKQEEVVMLQQMDSAIAGLSVSYEKIRDSAIVQAQNELRIKEKELKLLETSSASIGEGMLAEMLRAVSVMQQIRKTNEEIKSVDTAEISSYIKTMKSTTVDSKTAQQLLTDAIVDYTPKQIISMDNLTTALTQEAARRLKPNLGVNPNIDNTTTGKMISEKPSDVKMKEGAWEKPVSAELVAFTRFLQQRVPDAIVTSFNAGKHNYTKHNAADIRSRNEADIQAIKDAAAEFKKLTGIIINVRPELTRPKGQDVWSGPHAHTSFGGMSGPSVFNSSVGYGTPGIGDGINNTRSISDYSNFDKVGQPLTLAAETTQQAAEVQATASDKFLTAVDKIITVIGNKTTTGPEVDAQGVSSSVISAFTGGELGRGPDAQGNEGKGAITSLDGRALSNSAAGKLNAIDTEMTASMKNLSEKLRSELFSDGMTGPEFDTAMRTFQEKMKLGFATAKQKAQEQLKDALPMTELSNQVSAFWEKGSTLFDPMLEGLKKLGPEGEAVAAAFSGIKTISTAITDFGKDVELHGASLQNIATLASSVLSTIMSVTESASKAKVAGIDKEIAAEQKRDGKSAESVAKIQALEKKKDDIQRKQFNLNKKISMAQAVIATATGIAEALKMGPIAGPIMAAMIGAMGIAQIAIISGTQYQSSLTPKTPEMPSTLSIGKRGDSVDLAKGSNANAGGEVGYLRGSEGTGSNASNYRTVGSAYGGELMRGYGNRGFVVGEKGPEVITPETPITVTPANDVGMAQPINANFTIQALDSHGVQDILVSQKGNIIKLLREAANASGKTFMEDVNVNVYTRPNVNRL